MSVIPNRGDNMASPHLLRTFVPRCGPVPAPAESSGPLAHLRVMRTEELSETFRRCRQRRRALLGTQPFVSETGPGLQPCRSIQARTGGGSQAEAHRCTTDVPRRQKLSSGVGRRWKASSQVRSGLGGVAAGGETGGFT